MNTVSRLLNNITDKRMDVLSADQIVNPTKNGNFIIVDEEGLIQYKSDDCFIDFYLENNIKSISELQSDPDLTLILKGMKYNKTERLSIELLIYFLNNTEVKDYVVQISKFTLLKKKLFLLFFEENKVYKVFENKINTLQFALEKGNIPVLIADEDYRTKYITQNFEEIFDKNIEDLYDRPISEVLIDFLKESDESILLHAIESKSVWSKVINLKKTNGTNLFYDINMTPVFDSALGTWNYILSAYNITDHILKNRTLKKSEARLRAIINNISDGLFVLRKQKNELTFVIGNDIFFELFNINTKDYEQIKIEDYLDTKALEIINDSISVIETSKVKYLTDSYHQTGTDRHFEISTTFVEDKLDEERFYIITLHDITAKEKYERHLESAYVKEKELNRLKTLILHNMSHELRTPANAMMGYTEIIEDAINEKDYETVSQISTSVKEVLGKLISLFTNIIELASIESGEYELDIVRINCNQVLQSVYNKRIDDAERKNLDFVIDTKDRSLFIKTDWIKFEKVIYELVDNAIKFTKEGSVKIESYLNELNEAEIKITDTGDGIENSSLKKILEPFQQEDEFYTRSYEGSGLGITISHKLTSILGGKFSIESRKKVGTVIKLTFPSVSPKPTIEL